MTDAHAFAKQADIVPLDALSAPLIGHLQKCIRTQHKLLEECATSIEYTLKQVNGAWFATEKESKFITAIAKIRLAAREDVAAEWNAHHDSRKSYGCCDDPQIWVGI